MKRMWQNWLAIAALMTLTGTTMAQSGWNQPSEIGSYQSILARAGCDSCSSPGILGAGLAQPGIPMQGGNAYGGMQGGGMYGGNMQGSVMQGGNMQGGNMYGGSMQGSGTRGSAMQGGNMYGGNMQGSGTRGSAMQGGNMSGGSMQGSGTRGSVMQGGNMYGGTMQGGSGGNFGGAMIQGGAAAINGINGGAANMQGAAMGAAQAVQGQVGALNGGSVMNGSAMGINGSTEGAVLNGSMGIGSGAVGGSMGGQINGLSQGVNSVISGMPSAGVIESPGFGGSPMYGNSIGGSVMAAPAYSSAPVYSEAPVYSSGPIYSQAPQYNTSTVFQQSVVAPVYVNEGRSRRQRPNYTVGLTGLFFTRDYEDNRFLARNPSGATLFTNDADDGTFDGYSVLLGARSHSGSGFEIGYWALNPGSSIGVLTGANVATNIQGLENLTHVSSGRTIYDIYSTTVAQTIVRETDINNLEANLLRNGGSFNTRRGRRASYELLGGFRWFQFDESLQYTASIDPTVFPVTPTDFFYNLETENTLLGAQLGARNEICLNSKLRFFTGVKGGIFNNNIQTRQNITDSNGEIAIVNSGPAAGRPFSYDDEKNDVAFLGELDAGILFNLTSRARVRVGYRVLGVSGVALAADQAPFDFADPNELQRANSNGSLILGGGYYGLEFCF